MDDHSSLFSLLQVVDLEKQLHDLAHTKHAHAQEQAQIAANTCQERDQIHLRRLSGHRVRQRIIIHIHSDKAIGGLLVADWHRDKIGAQIPPVQYHIHKVLVAHQLEKRDLRIEVGFVALERTRFQTIVAEKASILVDFVPHDSRANGVVRRVADILAEQRQSKCVRAVTLVD